MLAKHLMFVSDQTDLSGALTGSYAPGLVAFSVIIAVLGAFAAFEVLERVKNAKTTKVKNLWLLIGGVSMGSGVWAMHFIGMLAFHLPVPVNYDVFITEASVIPAVFAGWIMLLVFSGGFPKRPALRILIGGSLMGGGIGAMHFVGMAAMRIDAHMYYAPIPFAISIGVAVILAISALFLRYRAEMLQSDTLSKRLHQASPLVMGLAVSGMHYTAMQAVYFVPYGTTDWSNKGIDPHYLSLWIGLVTIGIFVFINLSSEIGKRLEAASQLTQEIKERKKAEQLLRESESLFRAIIVNTTEGVITIDNDGKIETINPAAQRMFGYMVNELRGRSVLDLFPQNEHAKYEDYTVQSGKRFGQNSRAVKELSGLKKQGDVFPLEINLGLMDIWGQRKFVAVMRDITQRKQAEQQIANHHAELESQVQERTEHLVQEAKQRKAAETALRESEERLIAIMENLVTGVVVIDLDGKISYVNSAADQLFGGSNPSADGQGGKIIGRPVYEVFSLTGANGTATFDDSLIGKVANGGKTLRADDTSIVLADGTSISVSYGCSPLLVGGKPCGAILSLRDIRELKNAQAEAAQAQRHASVGQLAAGIAHEINTPAQYIGTNLQFLKDSHEDVKAVLECFKDLLEGAKKDASLKDTVAAVEEVLEDADIDYLLEEIPIALQQSMDGVAQVSNIVLAMKEFSHPGTKKKEPTDLNHNIKNTLTVCKNEWKQSATITLDLDPDLPLVPCLAGEINQVILNLVVNAAHAIDAANSSGSGVITISSRANGDWVELRIADTGIGIPIDIQQRVFDPFFTTKEVGKGTGQGLAITRDVIVEKHGGKIELNSEPGHGAEFVIHLPLI